VARLTIRLGVGLREFQRKIGTVEVAGPHGVQQFMGNDDLVVGVALYGFEHVWGSRWQC